MNIKHIKVILFISFFIFGISSSLRAQSVSDPDSALVKILENLDGEELTLSKAKEYAIENAASVGRAEAEYLAAKGLLKRERGEFDPVLFFNINHQDFEDPTASFFAGADVLITEQTTTNTGVKWKLPFGTQFELDLNTIRLKTNSNFAFLNPEYNAIGTFSFRQPLLNGFSISARKDLTTTELRFEAAKALFEQEKIGVKALVEQMYWNLYSAERDYAVQELTRNRAEAFLKEAKLRNEAGLVGPSQVANAKTFLAEQELLLIDRKEYLDEQSDKLAALIGSRPSEEVRFKVVDEPPTNFKTRSINETIQIAKNNNLEIQSIQLELEAAKELADAASWEALPRVDLVGSVVSKGLGGNSKDVIFGGDTLRSTSGGSFGDVLNQVINRDYPGWSIGLEINLPIGLRSGLGEKERFDAQALNLEHQYVEIERLLEQQIRSVHRKILNGNKRLNAAKMAVDAAQEQVRIGIIEFENGRITAFELVRLSEDFAVAQRRYSEALVKTANSVALLKKLTSEK